jgi:hypothetical protein
MCHPSGKTAARLMQESAKAQENGEHYALRTARAAATAIERRGGSRDKFNEFFAENAGKGLRAVAVLP